MAIPKTITSANAELVFVIPGLFDSPSAIKGFAADSAWANDALVVAETTMGVDGHMSAGFVFNELVLKVTLQADSDSRSFFESWFETMQGYRDILYANATLFIPSTNEQFVFSKGALTSYAGTPPGKKKLDPTEYEIKFERVERSGL